MPRILINPPQLQELAGRLRQAAGDLADLEGHLAGVLDGLDWEIRRCSGVDGLWQHARRQARMTAEHLEALARYLASKARSFEEADGTAAAGMDRVVAGMAAMQRQWRAESGPHLALQTFPAATVGRFVRLAGRVVPAAATAVTVPITSGGRPVRTRRLLRHAPGWEQQWERAASFEIGAQPDTLPRPVMERDPGSTGRGDESDGI